jgi:hypothetical protein
MTCPSCAGHGYTGYDKRERPVPCKKCEGKGKVGPKTFAKLTEGWSPERRANLDKLILEHRDTLSAHAYCGRPVEVDCNPQECANGCVWG